MNYSVCVVTFLVIILEWKVNERIIDYQVLHYLQLIQIIVMNKGTNYAGKDGVY